jgi:hypothetical protein
MVEKNPDICAGKSGWADKAMGLIIGLAIGGYLLCMLSMWSEAKREVRRDREQTTREARPDWVPLGTKGQ